MVSELPPFYSRIVFISSLWFTEQLKTAKLKLLCLVNENFTFKSCQFCMSSDQWMYFLFPKVPGGQSGGLSRFKQCLYAYYLADFHYITFPTTPR